MWDLFISSITDKFRMICTILAFVIPYSIYKINLKLREIGDPPWKKDDVEHE